MTKDFSKGNQRDFGQKYNHLKDPNDTTRVACNFCGKTTGRINRAKQHMIGNFRNASKCTKCPQKIREELTKLHKRKNNKSNTNEFSEFDEFDYKEDVGGEDEVNEVLNKNRGERTISSGSSN